MDIDGASICIRPAEPKDIPPIMKALSQAAVMGNSAPAFYFRWVIQEGIAVVAEKYQVITGFLIAERNDAVAYAQLIYLFVDPPSRKQGLGSTLMKHFLEICQREGVKYIDLHAQKDAAKFYRPAKFNYNCLLGLPYYKE